MIKKSNNNNNNNNNKSEEPGDAESNLSNRLSFDESEELRDCGNNYTEESEDEKQVLTNVSSRD